VDGHLLEKIQKARTPIQDAIKTPGPRRSMITLILWPDFHRPQRKIFNPVFVTENMSATGSAILAHARLQEARRPYAKAKPSTLWKFTLLPKHPHVGAEEARKLCARFKGWPACPAQAVLAVVPAKGARFRGQKTL